MKNFGVALLVVFALSITHSKAQRSFLLGIKGGGNWNGLYWDTPAGIKVTGAKSFVSYHVGVFARIGLKKKIFLIPELQYIEKGFRDDVAKYAFDYVSLPVLISFNVVTKFSLEAGPEFAYLTALKTNYASGKVVDISSGMRKFDFGITAGVRYSFLPRTALLLRYSLSGIPVVSIQPPAGSGYYNDIPGYNQTLQLSVAFLTR